MNRSSVVARSSVCVYKFVEIYLLRNDFFFSFGVERARALIRSAEMVVNSYKHIKIPCQKIDTSARGRCF